MEFRAEGSDEYRNLNCSESIDKVTALKLYMLPWFPTEIELSNIFAIFGDSYVSKTEMLIHCGFNSSDGCPGGWEEEILLSKQRVRDTVLPPSMFKETHRRKVQVPLCARNPSFEL